MGKNRHTNSLLFTCPGIIFPGIWRNQRSIYGTGKWSSPAILSIFAPPGNPLWINHCIRKNLLRMDVRLWSNRRLDLSIFRIFTEKDRKKTSEDTQKDIANPAKIKVHRIGTGLRTLLCGTERWSHKIQSMDGIFPDDSAELQAGRLWNCTHPFCAASYWNGSTGAILLSVPVPDGGGIFPASGDSIFEAAQKSGRLYSKLSGM